MDWQQLRKTHDTQDYYSDLIAFPEHMQRALDQMESFSIQMYPTSILVCGMGGSAIPGYLLKDYCRHKLKIPVEVANDYDIPAWVDEDTLVFVISYSGNTEEVLSCLKQSMSQGCKVVLISSGGLIEQVASKYDLYYIKAPINFQPRAATPYLFVYVLEVLRKLDLLFPNYDEAISELRKLNLVIDKSNHAKVIAEKLLGKMVYVYVPSHLDSVGRRLQSQCFNENAKMLAKYSVLPEVNHNETSAWPECQDLPLATLFCWDDQMSGSLKERMKFSEKLSKAKGDVFTIKARGHDLLSRMTTLIFQGDLISYYLSLLRGKNPLPVKVVEELKNVLKRKTGLKNKLIKSLGLD